MEGEKLGIEELKKVVKAGMTAGELIEGLTGGIGADDAENAFALIKDGMDAIKALPSAVPQYLDLDSTEKAELKAFVESEFDLENDKIESAVEMALKIVVDLSALGGLFKKTA